MLMPSSSLPAYRRYVISFNTSRTACSCHLLLFPLTAGRWSRPIPVEQYAHAIFLIPSSSLPAYRWYVISSDTCRTAFLCHLHLFPLTAGTWSCPIPVEQHAHTIFFSFAHFQRVRYHVRYLQNSMLMSSSRLPTYRRYVILSDTCRTACSRHLLLCPLTVCTWSSPIPAAQHAHAIFSFVHLQGVRHLSRYLQNSILMSSPPWSTYRWYVILSDTCKTECSCCLLPFPLTDSTWFCPIPDEQHAHAIIFSAHFQRVHYQVRYLQNSMLMSSSRLPAYRWYVILSDTCRTACSHHCLPIGSMSSCLMPAEHNADSTFLFSYPQRVCDLSWYLQNIMLTLTSLSAYRQYVILLDNCWWVCSHFLLRLLIGSAWCHPILAEQYAHPVFFLAGSRWSCPILAWQHVHTIWFGFLQRVCHLVWCP